MLTRLLLGALVAALPLVPATVGTAGGAAAAQGRAQTAVPVTIEVPGRSNEYASLAADGRFVALTWAASKPAGGMDIFAAVSGDAGASFSAPVRVNRVEGQAQVNGEQPPRVVIARRAASREIVVVWTAKADSGTRLLTARSRDDGRTFGATTVVPGSDAAGNRGWESIAVDGAGRVVALWLDHRDTAGASAGMHQHGATAAAAGSAAAAPAAAADPAAKAQLSQLYFGSLEGGAAQSIARGVCYCCKTALTVDGAITYAAWRHVYPGSRRDIAFSLSRDGGRTFSAPVRVSEDDWQLDGCPENGPAVAVDGQKRVHVIWPTLVQDGRRSSLRLFHASTTDGRRFSPRAPLPAGGAAYHPQVAVAADGTLLVAWDEVVGGVRQVKLARGRTSAAAAPRFEARALTAAASPGLYPVLAAVPDAAVVAWTSRSGDRSTITVARVPQ